MLRRGWNGRWWTWSRTTLCSRPLSRSVTPRTQYIQSKLLIFSWERDYKKPGEKVFMVAAGRTQACGLSHHSPVVNCHAWPHTYAPVQCIRTTVSVSEHVPVQCIRTTVQCIRTSVLCIRTPVQCIRTPVCLSCIPVAQGCAGLSEPLHCGGASGWTKHLLLPHTPSMLHWRGESSQFGKLCTIYY